LGVEVSELLYQINATLEGLDRLINSGMQILISILDSVSEKIKEEILDLIDHALKQSLEIIKPILEDLGLVLPAIEANTAKSTIRSSTADSTFSVRLKLRLYIFQHFNPIHFIAVIKAILGITLEELLTTVSTALDQLDILILETLTELNEIAAHAPEVAEEIREASDEHLIEARAVLKPVSDSLRQVLPQTLPVTTELKTAPAHRLNSQAVQIVDKFFQMFRTEMQNFIKTHGLKSQESIAVNQLLTQASQNINSATLQVNSHQKVHFQVPVFSVHDNMSTG